MLKTTKDDSISGYQLVVSENKKFTKNIKTLNAKTSKSCCNPKTFLFSYRQP